MESDGKSPKNLDTLANALANTLIERILRESRDNKLSEGDLFMTVDQISESYEVSRTIVREAVSQLRGLGILKSRQRKGLLVGRPDPIKLMTRWVPFYSRGVQGKEFHVMAQLRYALELGSVDIVISKASDEQLKRLSELANKFDKISTTEDADIVDLSFHRLILEMTGNPLIIGMHRVLSDYFHVSREAGSPLESNEDAVREHYLIVDAIQRRDNESLRNLLRCHLERPLDDLSESTDSNDSQES